MSEFVLVILVTMGLGFKNPSTYEIRVPKKTYKQCIEDSKTYKFPFKEPHKVISVKTRKPCKENVIIKVGFSFFMFLSENKTYLYERFNIIGTVLILISFIVLINLKYLYANFVNSFILHFVLVRFLINY